jgi:ABC-type sugar transport system ATPase subunit
MAEIRLENISHTYPRGNVLAIEAVNITLADGSNNALLGPSDCGKTRLMKIIAGLLKPTRGRVY